MKPILTIVLLVFYFSNVKSQSLSLKQEAVIKKTIQEHFGEYESSKINLQEYANCVEICGKDTLFNPNGYFYVFKLTGDTCIRLDKSVFHGFNFGRLLFAHQNELYALGGYGGFTCNNYLLKFNAGVGEWTAVKTTGAETPKSITGVGILHDSLIYSFDNFTPGNNLTENAFDSCVYVLNTKTWAWKKPQGYFTACKTASTFIKTKAYLIWLTPLKTVVFNRNRLQYVTFLNERFKLCPEMNFLGESSGNVIRLESIEKNKIKNPRVVRLNLDSVFNTHSKEQTFDLIKPYTATGKFDLRYAVIFIIILLIGFILYVLLKRKQLTGNKESNGFADANNEPEGYITILHLLQNSTVTTMNIDELDELFKITHLSFDSKKLKRHRIIKELNAISPNLITRIRSEDDKRQFIYKITKK